VRGEPVFILVGKLMVFLLARFDPSKRKSFSTKNTTMMVMMMMVVGNGGNGRHNENFPSMSF
jgi:hypothetical protein